MQNLIERILYKRKPKTSSFFELHHTHHKSAQVDVTSFQAKRLGLKYLGFGRYGKVMMPTATPTNGMAPKKPQPGDTKNLVGGQMMVTHIVKNGLLVPVTVSPPETHYYPSEQHTDHSAYMKKQAEKIKEAVKKLVGWRRGDWNRGIKAVQEFAAYNHQVINSVLSHDMLKKSHPTIINKIKCIDKLFTYPEFAKVGQDMPVYFATGATPKKGGAFQYKAYLSTTTNPKVALGMLGGKMANPDIVDIQHEDDQKTTVPNVIQLDLKKGQRALDVHSLTGGPDYNDKDTPEEFILPRDSHIVITDGPIYLKHAIVWRAELDQKDEDFEADEDAKA